MDHGKICMRMVGILTVFTIEMAELHAQTDVTQGNFTKVAPIPLLRGIQPETDVTTELTMTTCKGWDRCA